MPVDDPKYSYSQEPRHLVCPDDSYAIIDGDGHTVAVAETECMAEKFDDVLCGRRVDRPDTFCTIGWTPDDLETLFDVTPEQAREFYNEYENKIRDRLTEVGWDIIAGFGALANLKAQNRDD